MSIVEKAVDKHLRRRERRKSDDDAHKLQHVPQDALPEAQPTIPVAPEPTERDPEDITIRTGPDTKPVEHQDRYIELDFDRLHAEGIVPPESAARTLADEMRRIKRPLLANAFGRGVMPVENGNLIMLTSALSGEGKTFTAVNLAMSVALERERTVLLVDADVAKPHISRALGLQSQRGLLDLILDERLDVGDVLIKTDLDGLQVLPAGQRHPHATELLASDKMNSLVHELAGRYPNRIIIFDSPPLLQTSEAQVLGGLVGQVVLVVQAASTLQPAVQSALEMLDPTKAINLVLNRSRFSSNTDYYGGYYGD